MPDAEGQCNHPEPYIYGRSREDLPEIKAEAQRRRETERLEKIAQDKFEAEERARIEAEEQRKIKEKAAYEEKLQADLNLACDAACRVFLRHHPLGFSLSGAGKLKSNLGAGLFFSAALTGIGLLPALIVSDKFKSDNGAAIARAVAGMLSAEEKEVMRRYFFAKRDADDYSEALNDAAGKYIGWIKDDDVLRRYGAFDDYDISGQRPFVIFRTIFEALGFTPPR